MNLKKDNLINLLISILMIIQPLLDIFYLNKYEIYGLQINTIIRLILFGLLLTLMILKIKTLKNLKVFIVYIILIGIYFLLHHINAYNFNSYVPGNFNYSVVEELFYIIRMLIPIFLIYIVYNSNYEDKNFEKSIYYIVGIISFIIIITNVTKTSLCSYSDEIIKGNIFDWFSNENKLGYLSLASRGIFNNVIIFYLIIMLVPYLISILYKQNKYKWIVYLLIILSVISAYMVGTKSTTLGIIIIIIIGIILSLFFTIIKREVKYSHFNMFFLILLIIISNLMIGYSPMVNRNVTDKKIEQEKQNLENGTIKNNTIKIEEIKDYANNNAIKENIEEQENNNEEITINDALNLITNEDKKKELLVNYLSNYYEYYGINLNLINISYPYTNDPFFWKDFVEKTYIYERSNNRMVVQAIFTRIEKVNNNKYDKYLGITHSRTSKVFNLERDFLYQYYSMGILGVILLLGPYLLVIILSGVKILLEHKKLLNFKNCSILLGIGLTLCLAFYSGNTLENLGITIPLGVTCGLLIKKVFINKN